jgi:predicted sugar kinase
VRRGKVPGVGQSSWGPGLFAIVENEERAMDLAERLRGQFPFKTNDVLITQAANHGAKVDISRE